MRTLSNIYSRGNAPISSLTLAADLTSLTQEQLAPLATALMASLPPLALAILAAAISQPPIIFGEGLPVGGNINQMYVDSLTGATYGPKTSLGWPPTPAFYVGLEAGGVITGSGTFVGTVGLMTLDFGNGLSPFLN